MNLESMTAVQAHIDALLSAAQTIYDHAHSLIDALDQFGGDTDLESDLADDHDGQALELVTDDDEPSLGWTTALLQFGPSWTGRAAQPFDIDREFDPSELDDDDQGAV